MVTAADVVVAARRRRSWRWLLWAVGLTAVTIAARSALPEVRAGIAALGRADLRVLAVAVAVEVAALATLPLTFRAALRLLGGHAGYRVALDGTLGAFALSRVVPAGGLAGSIYAARRFTRAGNAAGTAGTAVAVGSVATMLTLTAVVAAGAVVAAVGGEGSVGLVWALGGVLLAAVTGAAVLRHVVGDPALVTRTCGRIAAVLHRPDHAVRWSAHVDVVATVFTRPRRLVGVAGWATLNWFLQLLALWTVFVAVGIPMPVGVLIMGFGAANVVTALPHTPGGLGVVEAGMTATYVALGVPAPTALVGVLCYRCLGHWLPVAAALPLALRRAEGDER